MTNVVRLSKSVRKTIPVLDNAVTSNCKSFNLLPAKSPYVILLDSMLELIAEKNKGIPASLANDQIKWEAFYKGSCKFYDTPQFENSYTGNVGAHERCVFNILKFRILYLSSWIGIDSTFGWPAGSIAEVLGDEYGRYMQ